MPLTSRVSVPRGPVLVVCGPGIAHYVPIRDLLMELAVRPGDVHVLARVPADSRLASVVRDDGFSFRTWQQGPPKAGARLIDAAGRSVLLPLVRLLAAGFPA